MKRILGLTLALFLSLAAPALADISFLGSAVGSVSPNGTFNIALPAACNTTNDFVVVLWASGDSAGGNNDLAVNGFTETSDQSIATDTADTESFTGYRYFVPGDTQVPTVGNFTAIGGTNASNAAVVMCFRGVATVAQGGPFDTAGAGAQGIDTSNANPPSHDWSGAAGVWTLITGATAHTGGATATLTAPANYTTNAATRNHDDTTDVLVGMGYSTAPADPEDPAVWTAANIGTAANNSWTATTGSLKPAPAVTCTAGLNLTLLGVGGCP